MDRRTFLRGTGATLVGGAGFVLGGCGQRSTNNHTDDAAAPDQNSSAPATHWRMATSWPKSLHVLQGGAEHIAQRIAEMTEGRFLIDVFAAGEVVQALDVFDAVQHGTVECCHTFLNYFVEKNEAFGITAGLPFGFTPQQQHAWLYYGGGLKATQEIFADFGIICFPAGNTGTQMGGWFKQEIHRLEDLKGVKMRIPGLGGSVMHQLGVETVTLASNAIFDTFNTDALDAAEWVGPYDDEKLGLHRIAQYYYYPGWWEPGTTLNILINKQAWDALPKEYQHILESVAYETTIAMLSEYETLNHQALARLVAGGTQLRPYSEEILHAAKKAAFALYEDIASRDESFRAMFEPWKDFRRHIYQWSRVNELSFAAFAFERVV